MSVPDPPEYGEPLPGQTSLTMVDPNVVPGQTYVYRLKYTDATGRSVWSNPVTITAPFPFPEAAPGSRPRRRRLPRR